MHVAGVCIANAIERCWFSLRVRQCCHDSASGPVPTGHSSGPQSNKIASEKFATVTRLHNEINLCKWFSHSLYIVSLYRIRS